jgi:arylsulfatase A-like enzyme
MRARFFEQVGFANYAVTGILIYFLIAFGVRKEIALFDLSFHTIWICAYSLFTANVLVLSVHLLTRRLRALRVVTEGLLLFVFMLVHAYHLDAKYVLDYSIIRDNAGDAFNPESGSVILSYFRPGHIVALIVILLLLPVFEWLEARRTKGITPPRLAKWILVLLGTYAAIVAIPLRTQDEVTGLLKQWVKSLSSEGTEGVTVDGFPYVRDSIAASSRREGLGNAQEKPNIILVMVESLSAIYTETRSPEGYEYTPVFNSLLGKGVSVDRFYANSVQTCRAQEATLLSVIPSFRRKLHTEYPDLKFKAFPEYLAEAGYHTLFVQAVDNLAFENTGQFMKRAGMQEVHSAYEFLRPEDKAYVVGWGPEDGTFYRVALDCLDQGHAKQPNKPIFAMLATTYNHPPFPDVRRPLYKKPDRIEQNYANNLHLGDGQLTELLNGIHSRKYLENTIVIITGDHSLKLTEERMGRTKTGFWEESFRVPFLILWEGRLAPQRLPGPFSQVDIAPTILDLAGIVKVKNHFVGRSIWAPPRKGYRNYLTQPYYGRCLGVIEYPYKFVRNMLSGDEYLFDLAADPAEKDNLIGKGLLDEERALRDGIRAIFLNQKILDENRLWP